jgi:adenosine deaminase
MRRIALLLLLPVLALCAPVATPASASEPGAAQALRSARGDTARLRAFLWAMPKGGDLHNHLSGAVYAESMVRWGAEGGVCVALVTFTASAGPCLPGQRPVADALTDNVLYNQLLAAWSMKGFRDGLESGHDHFFASFDAFGATTSGRIGDELAEVSSRAAAQNEQYLETLITPRFGDVSRLAQGLEWTDDLVEMRRRVLAAGILDVVPRASADLDAVIARQRALLRCDTPTADAACAMPVRFDVQGLRAFPKATVFAQMVLGFELMAADPRWVGFNLVQPEDGPVALGDYAAQMRMLGFLRSVYPKGHLTLHAGELTRGIAPPADLRFHIRAAVEVAKAERIGHGVDVTLESDPIGLLRELARRHVLVEVPLTSNRQILGVWGRAHPIGLYRRYGVPIALATDDEGVSRTDMTQQYEAAVTEQGFGYRALKAMAIDSLRYSFLPDGDRALALRVQRAAFARFEARYPG